jgi:plasmid stabilization system protein ParE
VAKLSIAVEAFEQLDRMIRTHSLPADTMSRVRRSIEALGEFPEMGRLLSGRWQGLRSVLGPWRWMRIVYRFEAEANAVQVVTIIDTRSAISPETAR